MDATFNRRFGYAWVAFAFAIAAHVTDEATHNFLAFYNPTVLWVRARVPWLPLPTFTFDVWLGGLIAGILLLFALSPLAFRGNRMLRFLAWPLGILVGVGNALGHIASTIYYERWMAGVYSSPFILAAGIWLLVAAGRPWTSKS